MSFRSIVVAAMLLAPVSALAQDATGAAGSPSAATAPEGMRVLAVVAGAAVGIIVVEALSGGAATAVVMAAPEAVDMGGAAYSLYEVVRVATGAAVGGWAGNWLYTNSK